MRWPAVLGSAALAVASLALPLPSPAPAAPAPVAASPRVAPDGSDRFAAAALQDLEGRDPTVADQQRWLARLHEGWTRLQVARAMSRGWFGPRAVADDLYEQILGRGPDGAGLQYWADRLAAGLWVRSMAARLYGSDEYLADAGGTTEGFVAALYQDVLGRPADGPGADYWVARTATDGRTRVALAFTSSTEARGRLVDALYDELLERAPDAAGRAYWADRLVVVDRRAVVERIVATDEYFDLAQDDPAPPVHVDDWVVDAPEAHGMDGTVLQGAADYAFAAGRNTQGVVVVHDGAIVGEWYAPGSDATSFAASWSVGKSFTSALIGIAIEEGHIPGVDEPMTTWYPSWAGTPRAAITLRDVLEMSSGLEWEESYDPADLASSDIIQMVLFQRDELAYAAGRPAEVAPGTRFNYSSGDTMLLSGVLEQATGMRVAEYAREKLFGPIGMDLVEWWHDGFGHTLTYCCLDTPTRGFARFGQLYLQDGEWDGQQVVPADWVQQSVTAAPTSPGFYGFQWWLSDVDGVPGDLFTANGHDGQFIYVIPSLDLVVVRNGTYVKDPGEAVADPNLFGRYPSDGLGVDRGTFPPSSWDHASFLAPIIDSLAG